MHTPPRVEIVTTVRQATMDLLRSLGMTTVFGNPGSTELSFLGDWPEDFRYVLGLQESVVVGMADGYAQATGKAAFVNLHSAAGVGHGLGSIYTAYRNQTPMVITAGQQTRDLLPLRSFLGASSAAEFPKPYVKWSCEPALAADVPRAIAQAHCIAMQKPCGPTFVSVPADDWSRPAEPIGAYPKSRDFAPDPALLRKIAAALNSSRKPAVVVGAGVARDQATDLAVKLADITQANIWMPPLSMRSSFPESHPLFAGFLPAAPEPLAKILSDYDLVLVLGAQAFTFHVPGDMKGVISGPPVYQITDDPEVAATAVAASSVLGSTNLALAELLPQLTQKARRTDRPRPPIARVEPADPIPATFVAQTIAELRQSDSVIVEECPSHKHALYQHLPINDNEFYSMASGGLGFGMGATVGLALARPSRHVVSIIGDGSAMYTIQAIWTAVQHKLPITFIILNNGGYGAMRAFSQFLKSKAPPGIDLPGLDFVGLAQAQGCKGLRIERVADLAPALRESFATKTPTLIEVIVDRSFPTLFKPAK